MVKTLKHCIELWILVIFCLGLTVSLAPGSEAEEYQRPALDLKALEAKVFEKNFSITALRENVRSLKETKNKISNEYGPDFILNYNLFPKGAQIDDGDLNTKSQVRFRINQDLIKPFSLRAQRLEASEAQTASMKAELEDSHVYAIYLLRLKYIQALQSRKSVGFYEQIQKIYDELLTLKIDQLNEKDILIPNVLSIEKERLSAMAQVELHKTRLKYAKEWMADFSRALPEQIKLIELEEPPPFIKIQNLSAIQFAELPKIKVLNQLAKMERAHSKNSILNEIDLTLSLGYQIRESQRGEVSSGIESRVRLKLPFTIFGIAQHKKASHVSKSNFWQSKARETELFIKEKINAALEEYIQKSREIKTLQKDIEENLELHRIEKQKVESDTHSIFGDPARVLELAAEIKKVTLIRRLAQYKLHEIYFRILYLSGTISSSWNIKNISLEPAKDLKFSQNKALWVWKVNPIFEKKSSLDELILFCMDHNIDKLYFSLNQQSANSISMETANHSGLSMESLSNFIKTLHEKGIKTSALIGDKHWVLPKKRQNMKERLNVILDFNSRACKECRFDAVHFDVEPHLLPQWKKIPKEVLKLYHQTLLVAKNRLEQEEIPLPLEADLPVHFEKVSATLLKKIIGLVDEVTLMAYSAKRPTTLLKSVLDELNQATEESTPTRIGIDAKKFKTETDMREFMEKAHILLAPHGSFSGFAIHDYHKYQYLKKRD